MISLKNNLKNIIGWKTDRKIIVFSVDDYGNIRLNSRKAREQLDKAGLKVMSRFDAFDSLENSEDLEMLFETLCSVSDVHGRHAVFTAFSVCCNINFDKIESEHFQHYEYEILPETYKKLSLEDPTSYRNAWNLWNEGISKKILIPQFHGREHFNVHIFEEKLKRKDADIIISLKNRSYTSLVDTVVNNVKYTASFEFWDINENKEFETIITEGLDKFKTVFGFSASNFNAPCGNEHRSNHVVLRKNGIKFIDNPIIKKEHQGFGKYKYYFNYTGKKNKLGMLIIVRNVVFEPTSDLDIDWVQYAINQISCAFNWHQPVIISSHRVNFCGHIEQQNRSIGLKSLKSLLKEIVRKWPDVEFMSADQLGNLINYNYDI